MRIVNRKHNLFRLLFKESESQFFRNHNRHSSTMKYTHPRHHQHHPLLHSSCRRKKFLNSFGRFRAAADNFGEVREARCLLVHDDNDNVIAKSQAAAGNEEAAFFSPPIYFLPQESPKGYYALTVCGRARRMPLICTLSLPFPHL